MNLKDLESYLSQQLDLTVPDSAINGVQCENDNPEKKISKIVSAVDASIETVDRAISLEGDVLLVHHGLFWGRPFPLIGRYYRIFKKLIESNLALIAIHLPLDLDLKLGNNIDLILRLDLRFERTFGNYKGLAILFEASTAPITFKDFVAKFEARIGTPLQVIQSHEGMVSKLAICSGGGLFGIDDAVKNGCDTFITGDMNHTAYYQAKEGGINLIAGGHYNTEVGGVRNLGKAIAKEFSVGHEFIDLPTGV